MEINNIYTPGFRKVPTSLLHALQNSDCSGAEFRIIFTVIDKTIGFQKASDFISITQFQKYTSLSRQSVCNAIKSTNVKRIILISKVNRIHEYKVNVAYETWCNKDGSKLW